MIVEMRSYIVKPRSVPMVEERFAEALTERVKYSRLGALWHTEIGALNQVIHVWPYESLADREKVRAEARNAKGWPPKINEFVLEQKSEIFNLPPCSPPFPEGALGNIYEIRSYTAMPGTMPSIIERWSEKIEGRAKLSPLVGCWYSDLGGLNKWVHIWAYQDFAHRDRVRQEATRLKIWPPQIAEFLVRQENMFVVPAACSPLH